MQLLPNQQAGPQGLVGLIGPGQIDEPAVIGDPDRHFRQVLGKAVSQSRKQIQAVCLLALGSDIRLDGQAIFILSLRVISPNPHEGDMILIQPLNGILADPNPPAGVPPNFQLVALVFPLVSRRGAVFARHCPALTPKEFLIGPADDFFGRQAE